MINVDGVVHGKILVFLKNKKIIKKIYFKTKETIDALY